MADAKQWGKPLPLGGFEPFAKQQARRTTDENEWQSDEALYAHYRRWCYLRNMRAAEKRDLLRWLKTKEIANTTVNGHTLWAIALENEEVEQIASFQRDTNRSATVIDRVRITRDLQFVGEVMTAGLELDWMTPSRVEHRDLEDTYKLQIKNKITNPVTWLVVVWNGKRRLIPADAIERLG